MDSDLLTCLAVIQRLFLRFSAEVFRLFSLENKPSLKLLNQQGPEGQRSLLSPERVRLPGLTTRVRDFT